jgi:hypothetical protein
MTRQKFGKSHQYEDKVVLVRSLKPDLHWLERPKARSHSYIEINPELVTGDDRKSSCIAGITVFYDACSWDRVSVAQTYYNPS